MPVTASIVLGGLQAGKGIFDIFKGGSDYRRAKSEMDRLQRPFYEIQKEYEQNRNLAGSFAGQGLPTSTRDYYTTESQRGLGSAFETSTTMGGSPNDVSNILDTYMRNIGQIAAQDATARLANFDRFINENSKMAGQKITQWHMNKFQPYADKMSLLSQQMNIAKQTQNAGWNSIIGAGQSIISNMQAEEDRRAINPKVKTTNDEPLNLNLMNTSIARMMVEKDNEPIPAVQPPPEYTARSLGMFNIPSQYAPPYSSPQQQQLLNDPFGFKNIWKG